MILICGIPSEPPVRLAIAAAEHARIRFMVFNQREAAACDISLDVDNDHVSGLLVLPAGEVALEEISGVYTRMMESDLLPENRGRASRELREHAGLLNATLDEWFEATSCRVVNRTSAMASNLSKPYQSQLIRRSGFRTPPTLITNEAEQAREFLQASDSGVVFKSVSSVRSIVSRLDEERLRGLMRVSRLPTQFQRLIEGVDIRVHVIGSRLFATEISTRATDYRYAGRENIDVEMRPLLLPDEIEAGCLKLADLLGLPFCGIDLLRTDASEYFCLEVNPSPGYSYYEETTEQNISGALISYLSGEDS